jgi:hypothetical protein
MALSAAVDGGRPPDLIDSLREGAPLFYERPCPALVFFTVYAQTG